ncbi:SHOCT domain-containing protein [Marispirochaeta sp.]|jgi:putative membrane protein|uniref:SHOCT domain-containing protein n=1 Tax=Marispirochaeta sp. TaxID=2038653 RepID=UPI0029C8F1E5|nr:SHOCT domain-containing protein [Marispirochaeta sp.]
MMHGWGLGGGVLTLLLLVAVIIGGVYLFRRIPKGRGEDESGGANPTPEEELKQRYARGEIDREEYQRIKNDLEDKA